MLDIVLIKDQRVDTFVNKTKLLLLDIVLIKDQRWKTLFRSMTSLRSVRYRSYKGSTLLFEWNDYNTVFLVRYRSYKGLTPR